MHKNHNNVIEAGYNKIILDTPLFYNHLTYLVVIFIKVSSEINYFSFCSETDLKITEET